MIWYGLTHNICGYKVKHIWHLFSGKSNHFSISNWAHLNTVPFFLYQVLSNIRRVCCVLHTNLRLPFTIHTVKYKGKSCHIQGQHPLFTTPLQIFCFDLSCNYWVTDRLLSIWLLYEIAVQCRSENCTFLKVYNVYVCDWNTYVYINYNVGTTIWFICP